MKLWNRRPTSWLLLSIDWSLLDSQCHHSTPQIWNLIGPSLPRCHAWWTCGCGRCQSPWAALSLPALATPAFVEFFRVAQIRWGCSSFRYLWSSRLREDAKVCCSGQAILDVDLDTDPSVIPSLAQGISDGGWIDLEKSLRVGQWGSLQLLHASSNWTNLRVPVGTLRSSPSLLAPH